MITSDWTFRKERGGFGGLSSAMAGRGAELEMGSHGAAAWTGFAGRQARGGELEIKGLMSSMMAALSLVFAGLGSCCGGEELAKGSSSSQLVRDLGRLAFRLGKPVCEIGAVAGFRRP